MTFRVTGVVPTYDNPATIRAVVMRLLEHVDHVVVVDDGSGAEGRAACAELSAEGLAHVVHHEVNGGKGAAVKTGLRAAKDLGFTHALQVDADGQHDIDDVPRFLEAARENPRALILGDPRYDDSAPSARRIGRKITAFWIAVECGRGVISDGMIGFRVYPVDAALAVPVGGDAMDFDLEIAVRLVWAGLPVINIPTKVRYLDEDEGGISHFRAFRDNVLISWLHFRLSVRRVFALVFRVHPKRLPE
ncbi:MAG: glycosyltransferase family 2 protein [Deltaproteobacteria bacterium]|nr:MAG: glycosyltransferase family 2 protein [Deltaproteobacteria bacterium]